ncbi:MAG: class I SAM-dependent DNA methyltransferase [Alphaproteobacteria bacterium]|nr:class I SAM-dependent DNA methyltransferase [Alphaproteobacteria bacterium]
MTPEQFIDKWRGTTRSERSAAQQHFLELCDMLGVERPPTQGPAVDDYTFEKQTRKIGDQIGYADVWKRGCFAWEYKKDRRNLVEAYAQLKQYADALENPPLLIVSDMQEIRVHTNFTNAIAQQHAIELRDLVSVEKRDLLRDCFRNPERLRPNQTREGVTAEAAARFASIALELRRRHDERRVAHFINRLVFCLFAEDIELLPDRVFAVILDEAAKPGADLDGMLRDLFRAMANRNGRFGATAIPWFNGGLFDDEDVLPLGIAAVRNLRSAARLDWKAIDPTIFGTLFEGGLDDKRRAEMASLFDAPDLDDRGQAALFKPAASDKGVGIHYTDEATIMKIIEPVVVAPLRRDWERIKADIRDLDERRARAHSPDEKEKLLRRARGLYGDFRAALGRYRVLDPACGSGNFLALSLRALKDFDLAVLDDAKAMGLPPDEFRVGPDAVMGIEINGYAAELARLTVWITELQWQLQKGHGLTRRPILDRLDGIVRGDALLTANGRERDWPDADVVVGNPPFLGGKRMRRELGDAYVERLFAAFEGRVPAEADLVCYWFFKSWERLHEGRLRRTGLVATSSIRGGANRRVLDQIAKDGQIFDAWDDERWVVKGVAVRVSLICFSFERAISQPRLDGVSVSRIGPDLSGASVDLTAARPLVENRGVAFMGDTKGGAFDIPGDLAREWLRLPLNPNGRPNSDVLRPWMNGMDVTRRPADKWIINFGWEMDEQEAALYEAPFAYCLKNVKPAREKNRRDAYRRFWWRHLEPRPGMSGELAARCRFLGTARIAKHRLFIWLEDKVLPDCQIITVIRDDDICFGIVHSLFHQLWSLNLGTSLEDRPRYTPSTTFETFPFPEGLTPNIPADDYADDPRAIAIAEAARRLDDLRNNWLNPADLVRVEPEVVPGYPDRILPRDAAAAKILKTRTLTNLYNERPAWLDHAHRALDAAVADAYGWPADIAEDEALARLLALNRERAAAGR